MQFQEQLSSAQYHYPIRVDIAEALLHSIVQDLTSRGYRPSNITFCVRGSPNAHLQKTPHCVVEFTHRQGYIEAWYQAWWQHTVHGYQMRIRQIEKD